MLQADFDVGGRPANVCQVAPACVEPTTSGALSCYVKGVLELELPPTDGPLHPAEEAESAIAMDPLSEPPADGADDFDDALAELPIQGGYALFERAAGVAGDSDDLMGDAGSAGLVGLLDLIPALAEERLSADKEEPRLLSEFLDRIDEAPDADEGGDEGPLDAPDTVEELPPSDDDEEGETGLDSQEIAMPPLPLAGDAG